MNLARLLVEATVNGLLLGGSLALLALGLNLIFGVVRIVHLAYGDVLMVAMYLVYWLVAVLRWPWPLAALATVAASSLLSALVFAVLVRPLLRAPALNQLLATGALSVVLQHLALLVWGADYRTLSIRFPVVQVGGLFLPVSRLVAFAGALGVLAVLWLFLHRTYVGMALRAAVQDHEAARLMGIVPQRLYLASFLLAGAVIGVVALFFSLMYPVFPDFGVPFTLYAFVIVVLGGLGNLAGTVVGALILSEVLAVVGVLVGAELSASAALVMFILVLLVRPGGVFGRVAEGR
ncbi:MAG TPA: branched-chain amino acid ABC transporter permease [Limnochordales bacterium]